MKEKIQAILLLPHILHLKTLHLKPVLLLYGLFLLAPVLVYSQNLDDFKTASEYKGVKSIPFSSLRGDAGSIQSDIDSWKKTTASFKTWKEYNQSKIENYKNIRLVNDDLEKKKQYIKELKSKNVDASQFEKELATNQNKIESYKNEIAAINDQVYKAIDAWDRLGRLRGGIREKFDDVLYKLSDAKSSPNHYLGSNPTDENKNKLIGYINDIKEGIESEVAGHKAAEEASFNAKQNMEAVLRRNSE